MQMNSYNLNGISFNSNDNDSNGAKYLTIFIVVFFLVAVIAGFKYLFSQERTTDPNPFLPK